MGWQTVFICDAHWEEEGGHHPSRIVLPDDVVPISEPCYRCSEPATIPVRRNVEGVQGGGHCECGEEGIVKVHSEWFCLEHLGRGADLIDGDGNDAA